MIGAWADGEEVADDADLRSAAGVFARAAGLWREGGDDDTRGGHRWALVEHPFKWGEFGVVLLASASPTGLSKSWPASPRFAVVWLLAMACIGRCPGCSGRGLTIRGEHCVDCDGTGRRLVSLGRCARCRGRGEWSWWVREEHASVTSWPRWAWMRWDAAVDVGGSWPRDDPPPGSPWRLGQRLSWSRAEDWGVFRHAFTGPCPACSGSGQERVELGRLILDARHDDRSTLALAVLSDQLQADPASSEEVEVGVHLGHLLAGRREGTAVAARRLAQRSGDLWLDNAAAMIVASTQ